MADCQQARFSFNIDAGVVRSFKENQKFWAPGQTLMSNFHLSQKNTIYVFFSYFINGKFKHQQLTATAKSPLTAPQTIPYGISAKVGFTHLSFGWKRYLIGDFENETGGNLYAYGGLGLMMGRVVNNFNRFVDTAEYNLPVLQGNGKFKRLTVDLAVGYELPIGGDYYVYIEGRTLVPLTRYPTPYLLVNGYAPINAAALLGLRMLF